MDPLPHVIDPDRLLQEVDWVRKLAKTLVRDENLAEDLAQDAVLTALDTRGHAVSDVRAWLKTVLFRRAHTAYRTDRRRLKRERLVSQDEAIGSAEAVLERAELQHRVVEQLLALREPYRTTILLSYFEGLDGKEIAQRLSIDPATVRSRMKRGLDELRSRLDDRFGDRATWCSALALLLPQKSALFSIPLLRWFSLSKGFVAAATVLIGTWALLVSWPNEPSVSPPVIPSSPVKETPRPLASDSPVRSFIDSPSRTTEAPPAPTREVRVLDKDGLPCPGARVAIFPPSPTVPGQYALPRMLTPLLDWGLAEQAPQWLNADGEGTVLIPLGHQGSLLAHAEGLRPRLERTVPQGRDPIDISLREGASLDGTILSPRGHPVVGADVVVFPREFRRWLYLLSPEQRRSALFDFHWTKTDASGSFRCRGLDSGDHYIAFSHPSNGFGLLGEIAAGSQRTEWLLPEKTTLRQFLVDEDGLPIQDATVDLVDLPLPLATFSVTNGELVIEDVFPGDYLVRVHRDDKRPTVRSLRVDQGSSYGRLEIPSDPFVDIEGRWIDDEGHPIANANLLLHCGESAPFVADTDSDGSFRLQLPAQRVYQGILYLDQGAIPIFPLEVSSTSEDFGDLRIPPTVSASGSVVDEQGRPLAGARVWTDLPSNESSVFLPSASHGLNTDAQGHFDVLIPRGQETELHIEANGYQVHREVLASTKGDIHLGTRRLQVGYVLSGVVVDNEDRPVSGCRVWLQPSGDVIATKSASLTDEHGAFRVDSLPFGSHHLLLEHPDFAPTTHSNVIVGESSPTTFELESFGTLRGRTLDSMGTPIAKASVSLSPKTDPAQLDSFTSLNIRQFLGARKETIHHPQGEFVVERLEPGAYTLRVSAPGYAIYQEDLRITSGNVRSIVVRLGVGHVVRGRVLDPEGKPIQGARVGVPVPLNATNYRVSYSTSMADMDAMGFSWEPHGDDDQGPHSITDDQGRYVLEGLHPGIDKLQITHQNFVTETLNDLCISGPEDTLPDCILSRGGTILGKLQSPTPDPHAIILIPLDSKVPFIEPRMTRTKEDGSFAFRGLSPGRYGIQVSSPDPNRTLFLPNRQPLNEVIDISGDETIRRDLTQTR